MKTQAITFTIILLYVWLLMILLGAILLETLIIYPNIFHDIPRSFETGMAFMTVRGPSDFFPLVGMLTLLTGIGAVILGWGVPSARYWILSGVIIIFVGEFLLSAAFFWPRNTIMFEEGTAVHSVAYLQQTALEFQTGHWLRVAFSAAAAVLSFKGFLEFYRNHITTQNVLQEHGEPSARSSLPVG